MFPIKVYEHGFSICELSNMTTSNIFWSNGSLFRWLMVAKEFELLAPIVIFQFQVKFGWPSEKFAD